MIKQLSFPRWARFFESNAWPVDALPWSETPTLAAAERMAIASSVQQFQLGEGAQGRGFVRRATAFAEREGEAAYVDALRLFIAEEQRHSAVLGRFMDLEGIARLDQHWIDNVFRRLRKLAGLELCVMVLVAAECISVPYYRALHDATASPLLRAICRRILTDESAHLLFQGAALGRIRAARTRRSIRVATPWLHRMILAGTLVAIWRGHAAVFERGGWSWTRVAADSFAALDRVERAGAPDHAPTLRRMENRTAWLR